MTKGEFVDQLCKVWPEKFSISNIQSGFRKTGIFPLDPSQFPSIKFNPGKLKAYNEREQTSVELPPLQTSIPHVQLSSCSNSSEKSRFRETLLQLSQQLAAYMATTSCLHADPSDTPELQSTSTQPLQQRPTPMSVSEIFFSRITPSRIPQTGAAVKRKRINRSSAVLTSEEYLEAIQSLTTSTSKKPRPARISLTKVPAIDEDVTDCDEDDDIPKLPPPLPKPLSTPRSPRKPRLSPFKNCLLRTVPTGASRRIPKNLSSEVHGKSCLYCTESDKTGWSREKWLSCRICYQWAHNECAGISPSLTQYVCEFCL